jgi:ketosteroid isomerase-like protein
MQQSLGSLLLLSSLPAAPQVSGSTHAPICQARREWIEAFNHKDLTALMALYAGDAVLLPPSGERVIGKDNISAYFKRLFDSATTLTIKLDSDQSDTAGQLGYDSGRYEGTVGHGGAIIFGGAVISGGVISGGGGLRKHLGNYLVILKGQAAAWLIVQQAIAEVPSNH